MNACRLTSRLLALALLLPAVHAQFSAEYFAGAELEELVLQRADNTIDFDWGGGSAAPGLPADGFSARWTGSVVPLSSGLHRFHVAADDGARLWVDGTLLIDQWQAVEATESSGRIGLSAGQAVPVVLEYFEKTGAAHCRLEWTCPGHARRLVRTGAAQGLNDLHPFEPFYDGVFPASPPGQSGLVLVPATADLEIGMLLALETPPGAGTSFAASRDGQIVRVLPDPALQPEGSPFLDISGQVHPSQDSGLMGLAFHPDFAMSGAEHEGEFFLFYTHRDGSDDFLRLSRFRVWPGQSEADPGSEEILIQQRLGPSLHRGGALLFGPDGYLYMSVGDLGQQATSQSLEQRFNSAVLRLDVDQDLSRSHPIITALEPGDPASFSQGYTIPDDNPFVGQPGVLEEYYALGLRNPHRMTLDPPSGLIHIGDVGSNWEESVEEINLLQAGGNYGWPFREGSQDIRPRPNVVHGQLLDPSYAYARSSGACVIGGYVYRGAAIPWLQGRYVFGDWTSGTLWASLSQHGTGTPEAIAEVSSGLVTFGVDAAGELNLAFGSSKLYRLVPQALTAEPPATLSGTGVFSNLATLAIDPAFVPYSLNSPLWSDGANKQRWMAIPNDGSPAGTEAIIGFEVDGPWSFPEGSVLVKHFELPLPSGQLRRIETRFLVHGENDSYYGVTYRWRSDGSDADLLTSGLTEDLGGGLLWDYPSRAECTSCHNSLAGSVLGPGTAQLNGDHAYATTGREANQLATLAHVGLLVNSAPLSSLPRAAAATDLSEFLELRARSYLDVNCAHCHLPDGPGRGEFDTRLSTPSILQGLIGGELAETHGVVGAQVLVPQDPAASMAYLRMVDTGPLRMPAVGSRLIDPQGVALLAAWIAAANEPQGGFAATYYSDTSFGHVATTRTDLVVDFNWGPGSPAPGVPIDDFTVRWMGEVTPTTAGVHAFHARVDGGVRLWVDGALVLDEWTSTGYEEFSAPVALLAGVPAPLVLEYLETEGLASASLEWTPPSHPRQVLLSTLRMGNSAPSAHALLLTTPYQTALTLTLQGSDDEQVGLDFAVRTQPEHGRLMGLLPEVTYVPDAGYSGSDRFRFVTWDGALESSPADVTIVVGAPPTGNTPPVVDAGPEFTTVVGSPISLQGSVEDDGELVSVGWQRVAGPAVFSFGEIHDPQSPVTFTLPGTYVLRLIADDGEYVVSDTVSVHVQ